MTQKITPLYILTLKYRMYTRGLTQRQIAKMLDISPSRLNDFIKGRAEPSLMLARKMSECLEIKPEAFFRYYEHIDIECCTESEI